jgi:hypothetical protein
VRTIVGAIKARYARWWRPAMSISTVTVVVSAALMAAPVAHVQSSIYFADSFEGSAVDSSKWNTTILLSGLRWCDSHAGPAFGPGAWVDPTLQSCNGATALLPFGSVLLAGGLASFDSPQATRTFPYMWAGPPSRPSPFPTDGDFELRLRVRYDRVQGCGDGIEVLATPNSDPSGANAPEIPSSVVMNIWADGPVNLNLGVVTGKNVPIADPASFHVVMLRYVAGEYSAYIDDQLVAGPTASTLRPNCIWIGNPVLTWWGACGWSAFTLDFINVEQVGATPAVQSSFGQIKGKYIH